MLRYLLEKEFKQIARDRFTPLLLFLFPLIELSLLPFASSFEMRNIKLSIVDHDYTGTSRQLIEKVVSSGYFYITDNSSSYDKAFMVIADNEADIILEIPQGFEHDLNKNSGAKVLIAANAINGAQGSIGSSYLSLIIQNFDVEVKSSQIQQGQDPKICTSNLFNPFLDYKRSVIPGFIVFFLTSIGGFMTALNIVSEKVKGTIDQINVSPVSKLLFLLSKVISTWTLCMFVLTFAIFVVWLIFDFFPVGNLGVIYLFAAIYLIAFAGFGVFISSFMSSLQQVALLTFFCMVILSLLSGILTPISSMPEWIQQLTLLNPARYFVEVMRTVYLKGSSVYDLRIHFMAITCFALFFNTLAVIVNRKKI